MKIAFFSTQPYDIVFFNKHKDEYGYELVYFESSLTKETANLVDGAEAVCVFVNDKLGADVMDALAARGVRNCAQVCWL